MRQIHQTERAKYFNTVVGAAFLIGCTFEPDILLLLYANLLKLINNTGIK